MARVVLVTGGARGIGRALVEAFASDSQVVFSHRGDCPEDMPGVSVQSDFAVEGAPVALVSEVMERFGRLDVIVNNAGTIAETPVEATDLAPHREIFEVNVLAPMALLGAALPHLEAGACVVNITSQNARLPALAAPAYSASKAALECWTKNMAKVLGPHGIRVNAVAPGAVERPLKPRPQELLDLFLKDTALGTLATMEDIAAAVRFLASSEAKAITGEVLTVNGGYRL